MLQAETGVTYDKFTLGLGGALTLVGPNPSFGTPNSNPFKIIGADCPTCGPVPAGCSTTAVPPKDAIGIYDPTHAKDPSAVQTVIGDLAKPNNYIGANSAPDVHNANLGTMTAADLNSFVGNVASVATYTYGSNPSSIYLGSLANPAIDGVNGDFSLGPSTGYGILVVTGTLTISGNYSWNGLILVIGAGASVMNGGGNGQITGGVFIANTAGGTINAPSANWNAAAMVFSTAGPTTCWRGFLTRPSSARTGCRSSVSARWCISSNQTPPRPAFCGPCRPTSQTSQRNRSAQVRKFNGF